MPRSMADPDYEHQPQTDEHRQKLSEAQRARLGIPEGHDRVYGIHVPQSVAGEIRKLAADIARREGFDAAHAFVARASANEWRVDAAPQPQKNRLTVWTPERRKAASEAQKARWAAKRAAEQAAWERLQQSPSYRLRAKLASFREEREKARVRWAQFNTAIEELEAAEKLLDKANIALRKYRVIDDG